ncbi:oxidoreductase [Pedobacter mendelii]|uniref:oxidoreductase n=1 Tax=Pedobacter mendelii TaxID=1908240 RepID=UPI0036100590
MEPTNWKADDIPSLQGQTIVITGANSGIGLETSKVLSKKGAQVIMAVRNLQKGKQAVEEIQKEYPDAKMDLMVLDLADFDSIKKFADDFKSKYPQLNVLINNAGVMSPPNRETTKQGFEIQLGTNHLGHFLLTGLVLDVMKKTPNSRVAVQSSLAHKMKRYLADINFDDLNWEKIYNKDHAYGQSKLANLLFAYELDRKLKANNIQITVAAAHPGFTKSNLQKDQGFIISEIVVRLLGQKVDMGALPILRAATENNLKGAEYFGPIKSNEMKGYPELVKSSEKSHNIELAKKLWEISEKLTGFTYKFN